MTTEPETVPPPAAPAEARPSEQRRSTALVAGAVLAVGAGLGAVGGWLWYTWWAPPATGRIYETASGIKWYPDPWDPGQHQVFAGTAEYALVGLVCGVLLGVLAAVAGKRQAYAAVAALLVGSALAAYVALLVGTTLSPPDPQTFATPEHVGDEYPAAIEVTGWTAYLTWPIGALGAYSAAVLALHGLASVEEVRPRQPGDRLERPSST